MITISDAAVEKIKEMLQEQEQADRLFLRLGVKSGGCSGFSYSMGFDDERKDSDRELEVSGLKVVVDDENVKYLNGLEIDFEQAGMDGGFTIHNPNAIATCGCGQSFRTRDEAGVPEEC